MSLVTFVLFAVVTSFAAYIALRIIVVYPAKKKYQMQDAYTTLAKGIKELNIDALPTGTIKNGDHLHDKFYLSIFQIYMQKQFKMKICREVEITRKGEEDLKQFRAEVENLPPEVKKTIVTCLFSIGKLLFLHNPIKYPLTVFKYIKSRRKYDASLHDDLVESGERVLIRVRKNINFDHHCHVS